MAVCLFIIQFLIASKSAIAYQPQTGKITTTLGMGLYKTVYNLTANDSKAPYKANFGIIANGDFNENSSLEIALFHINKNYLRAQNSYLLGEEGQQVLISLGYRRWVSSRLSIGALLDSSYAVGEPHINYNDQPNDPSFATNNQTSAHDNVRYSACLSLMGDVYQTADYSITLDARYSNLLTGKSNEYGDIFMLFFGYRFANHKNRSELFEQNRQKN